MSKITYNEYMKQLNSEALYRMLSDMTEVDSLEIARQVSEGLLSDIAVNSGLSKAKIRKAKFAVAHVKFNDNNYLSFLYDINGAQVMLRATNVDTKKFYIPNEVWMVLTDRETGETKLHLTMSLGGRE